MLFKKCKVQNVQSFSEIKCSTETKNMSGWPHVHYIIIHAVIQNMVSLYYRHNCAKETCQHYKCG